MMAFNYESAALPVREDLKESYREFWNTLAQAGTWWDDRVSCRASTIRKSREWLWCGLTQTSGAAAKRGSQPAEEW